MGLRQFAQEILNGLVGEDQPDYVRADMAESGLQYSENEFDRIPGAVESREKLSDYMLEPTTNTGTSAEPRGSN